MLDLTPLGQKQVLTPEEAERALEAFRRLANTRRQGIPPARLEPPRTYSSAFEGE